MLAGVRGYIATVAVFIAADGGKQKIAEKSVAEGVVFIAKGVGKFAKGVGNIAEGVGKQKKAASP